MGAQILSFIIKQKRMYDPTTSFFKDRSTIEVCRLAVLASMRRRKIGQLLVQKIFQVAKTLGLPIFSCKQVGLQLGFERATLETDSGTLVAINFYKNTGWTEVIGREDPIFTGSEELSLVSSPVLDMEILYESGI